MPLDLSDEDISRMICAIEHYQAYLRSQRRDDTAYQDHHLPERSFRSIP